MKILYQQDESGMDALAPFSIQRCYVKAITGKSDAANAVKTLHHHTGFEIHMIQSGTETYVVQGERIQVRAGEILVIPPRMQHQWMAVTADMRKCAASFSVTQGSAPPLLVPLFAGCRVIKMTPEMLESLRFIECEAERGERISPQLIANRMLELLVSIAREAGYRDLPDEVAAPDDPRMALARTFIRAHITEMITCEDVAQHCHVSVRQLSRLFVQFEGVSPLRYLHREKIAYIENLLSDRTLTLREISERMHFGSEYYFNAFMKKHAGMTPGAYRRMIRPAVDADSI